MRRRLPGDFEGRLARLATVERPPGTEQPLAFLAAVVEHQLERALDPAVGDAASVLSASAPDRRTAGRYPVLDLPLAVDPILAEVRLGVDHLGGRAPSLLAESAFELSHLEDQDLHEMVETWLDEPALLEARVEIWVRIAAAPVLELAAKGVQPPSREQWGGRACPVCGDLPSCSVIVEETAGFLHGAPRYLVCHRCATWWGFRRAACAACGEEDSTRIVPYATESMPGIRLDACHTCQSYLKTFDLREPEARSIAPVVDDVATLALDLWAREQGLKRPTLSLAGL